MNGELLQRCFVNIVCAILDEEIQKHTPKYASYAAFAKVAFPNEAHSYKFWQAIRLGQKGKPRGVSIEDAFNMAQALGESVDRLLIKAEMLISDGWDLSQDVFSDNDNKKRGRPAKKALEKKDIQENQSAYTHRPTLPTSDSTGPSASGEPGRMVKA